VNWAITAVKPPIIKRMIKVFEANNTVENKANKIRTVYKTGMHHEAGVGAVIAESNQRWKG
jgi:hypothetical protein